MKITKGQFIVSIAGIPGNWSQSTGGSMSAEVTKDYDGGSTRPDMLGGLPSADDLELTRAFDPVRDIPLMAKLRKELGRGRYTISKQATDANFGKVAKPLVYAGCVLIGVNDPESDASSADVAQIVLKFATTGAV